MSRSSQSENRVLRFDRLELDAWAEEYKRRNGRPGLEED